MLLGPHSPFGNQSQFTVSETQQDFAMRVIDLWRSGEVDAMAPTREATDRFNESIRAGMAPTVWVTGCDSWFIGKDGVPSVWPFPAKHHRDILRAPELADWDVQPGPAARARADRGRELSRASPRAPRSPRVARQLERELELDPALGQRMAEQLLGLRRRGRRPCCGGRRGAAPSRGSWTPRGRTPAAWRAGAGSGRLRPPAGRGWSARSAGRRRRRERTAPPARRRRNGSRCPAGAR